MSCAEHQILMIKAAIKNLLSKVDKKLGMKCLYFE